MFPNLEFANPWFLTLLLLIPLIIFIKLYKKKEAVALVLPSTKGFQTTKTLLPNFIWILFILRLIIIALLIIAIARPRSLLISNYTENQRGVDIFMVVDVSLSMLAKDLDPNRITALKEVAEEFAKNRKTDRIGLLAYSGEALTKVPLTSDRDILIQEIQKLQMQELEGGTAIGVGLATAVNHFKNSITKSKIIILLTDGVNNDGFVDPIVAAKIAKKAGIKVYTIGLGTNGMALFPSGYDGLGRIMYTKQKVEIDENLLKEISIITKGKYFRATSKEALSKIYKEIDQLEKSNISETKYYNYEEKYRPFVIIGLLILLFELLIRATLLKSIKG